MFDIASGGFDPQRSNSAYTQVNIDRRYDLIGNKFNKEVVKGEVNNEVASSAPKKVSISLDRYETEFDKFDFMSFGDGMKNYLNWYEDEYIR